MNLVLPSILASIALKSSLLLSVGLLISSALALSAATRHLILLAALVASLVLPVVSLCLPELPIPVLEAAPARVAALASASESAAVAHVGRTWPATLATTFLLVWAVGAAMFAVRTARSWFALADVVRRAQPIRDVEWVQLLSECSASMSLPPPRLVCSDETDMALACGAMRPVIVLPVDAQEWSETLRRDVLLHELSHIERRDAITQFVAQLARDLYFWNPFAVIAERRLRKEREFACDDRVLSCGRPPETYAATLVDVAESFVIPDTVAPAMAHSISQLEDRVRAVLDVRRPRDRVGAGKVAAVVIPAAALLLPLAAIRASEEPSGPSDLTQPTTSGSVVVASAPSLRAAPLVYAPLLESNVASATAGRIPMTGMEPPVEAESTDEADSVSASGVVSIPRHTGAVMSGTTFGSGSGGNVQIVTMVIGADGRVQRMEKLNGGSRRLGPEDLRPLLEASQESMDGLRDKRLPTTE